MVCCPCSRACSLVDPLECLLLGTEALTVDIDAGRPDNSENAAVQRGVGTVGRLPKRYALDEALRDAGDVSDVRSTRR